MVNQVCLIATFHGSAELLSRSPVGLIIESENVSKHGHNGTVTVNLLHERLSTALVDSSVPPSPTPLLTAARQQQLRGAKMINNDWQALGVGLLDTREIARIVASNAARIDLSMWQRSERYHRHDNDISKTDIKDDTIPITPVSPILSMIPIISTHLYRMPAMCIAITN